MLVQIKKFLRDEEGATAVEYGLIAALIAVVILGAVSGVGEQLKIVFENILDALK
jgi:pilus assembly protein Flp/PilA